MDDLIELRTKKAALEEELQTVEAALQTASQEDASEAEALRQVHQEILEGLQLIDETIRHIIHSLAQDANLPGDNDDGEGRNTSNNDHEHGDESYKDEQKEQNDQEGDDHDNKQGAGFIAENLRVGDFCSTLFEGQIRNAFVVARPVTQPTFSVEVVIVGLGTRTQVAQVQPPRRPSANQLQDGIIVRVAYSQDWVFYPARILRRLPDDRFHVHYTDYANEETVSIYAIDHHTNTQSQHHNAQSDQSDPRAEKPAPLRRDRKKNSEQAVKVAAWQKFANKSASAKRTGFLTGKVHKESIFRSPDSVDGKVGVTGSGKGMTQFQTREKYLFRPAGSDE